MVGKGSASPWGVIDWAREIAPGIVSVSTASHGGFYVSRERLATMPEALARVPTYVERSAGVKIVTVAGDGFGGRWYEEDCDAALVALAWPEAFPREYLKVARIIGARAHVSIAAWIDSLPANHPVNCYPGAPAVEDVPPSSEFQLTGSDRAADAPGQGGLL